MFLYLFITSCSKDVKIANLPPAIKAQSFNVAENIPSESKIGKIIATDANGDNLHYIILKNPGNLFTIKVETGELFLSKSKLLDFETQIKHTITVEVNDSKESSNAEITINVSDINENQPPSIQAQSFNVAENILDSYVIGTILATDSDNDPLTFSITKNDNGLFEISNSGELSLVQGKELDYETKKTHQITVQVTDGEYVSSANITINVTKISSPVINIPDVNFKNALLKDLSVNTNQDNEIQLSEANSYNRILWIHGKNISDLTGIEHFINTPSINCNDNNIVKLDLSKNIALKELGCKNNKIKEINISKNANLSVLDCSGNQLNSLDISKNLKLNYLDCSLNKLLNLNINNNFLLKRLSFYKNEITSIDLSKNVNLERINCSFNKLTSLSLIKNINLKILVAANNSLGSLEVLNNKLLNTLYIQNNEKLTNLDLSNGYNDVLTSLNTINCKSLICIKIDAGFTPKNTWVKDNTATYNTICN